MDEKKQTGEGEAAKPEEDGVQSETDKRIAELNEDTERINKAIAENDNAKARKAIGGETDAGQQPEKAKEETPKEYKDRMMSEGYNE